MLNEQTKEKMYAMKLNGMAEAYDEQRSQSQITELSFDERLALLIERQWLWKENRALNTRLSYAKLKEPACIEDLDFKSSRGLSRAQLNQLSTCDWARCHQSIIVTGPTGTGKTFLACALAQKACREGFRALYFYAPKLFRELKIATADGSMPRLLKKLLRVDVLVVDDWGLAKIDGCQYRQFLEILDDRQGNGSTVITSQFPINLWHENIDDPTVADAILDRLIHNSHRIELEGDSMRRKKRK